MWWPNPLDIALPFYSPFCHVHAAHHQRARHETQATANHKPSCWPPVVSHDLSTNHNLYIYIYILTLLILLLLHEVIQLSVFNVGAIHKTPVHEPMFVCLQVISLGDRPLVRFSSPSHWKEVFSHKSFSYSCVN